MKRTHISGKVLLLLVTLLTTAQITQAQLKLKVPAIGQKKAQETPAQTTTGTATQRTVADLIFCDDTDDNFNPLKPVTSINSGDGVNFLARLKEGLGARFFIWAVFEIKSNGDETFFKDVQINVDDETSRWFATVDKTYFPKAGKYAVYMLPQNGTNSGTTVNKPTNYYARGILTVN